MNRRRYTIKLFSYCIPLFFFFLFFTPSISSRNFYLDGGNRLERSREGGATRESDPPNVALFVIPGGPKGRVEGEEVDVEGKNEWEIGCEGEKDGEGEGARRNA